MKQEEADKIFEQRRLWGLRQFRIKKLPGSAHVQIEEWDFLRNDRTWEKRSSYEARGMFEKEVDSDEE